MGGGGVAATQKNQALSYFSDAWARFFCFFIVFFGLLLEKFWHHYNRCDLVIKLFMKRFGDCRSQANISHHFFPF